MKKGRLITLVVNDDMLFDFNTMTQNKGVSWLTIENLGQALLIIDDVAGQSLQTGEKFVIESPMPIVNTDFRIKFKGKNPKAVLRYIIEVEP